MQWAVGDVAADGPTLIGRNRGELRGSGDGVSTDIDRSVRCRAQTRIECYSPALRHDIAGIQVEAVDIGDPPGTVNDTLGLDRMLRPALLIDDAEPVSGSIDPLDLDPGMNLDPDPLGGGAQLRDCIKIHIAEEPRQQFEDRDLGAGAGIDMAEFER